LPENIEALAMDFDGVLTDNRVTVSQSGVESVACSRSDGMGLARLRNLGLRMIVLSSERNPVVQSRCLKLKLDCLQGLEDKKAALQSWIQQNGLNKDNVIFLGNDTNDSECLMEAGCGVVVQDAHPDVKKLARIILTRGGGNGAVRELTDQIELKLKDKKNGQRN
jgi:YrbI family 3-deoxy-D-manno-octulosonate 8-phosphate phosphatase